MNIFIDTQDMEERYGEELYKDYLEKQVKDYKSRIEKAVEYIINTPLYETLCDYNMEEELEIQNVSDETATNKLLNILNGRSDEQMNKLYLLLLNMETGKQFFKYFETEFEMDKFKRKLRYSTKIMVVEDSRDMIYDYNN